LPDTKLGKAAPLTPSEQPRQDRMPADGTPSELPIGMYALLMRLETSKSAVVIKDSGNLAMSTRLPFEVAPSAEILDSDVSLIAGDDELRRAGLNGVFPVDSGCLIQAIQIRYDDSLAGTLLVMTPQDHAVDDIHTVCAENEHTISQALSAGRARVRTYEWQMLRTISHCAEPCLAIDATNKVVAANAVFCDLVELSCDDLIGSTLNSVIQVQEQLGSEFPQYPDFQVVTTPLFVKTRSLFFMTDIRVSRLQTVCGERSFLVFSDLLTDRRTGNSNIQLLQKLSEIVMEQDTPPAIIRKLLNILTLTLDASLICLLKRKDNDELVVTPYSNRRLDTLTANYIQPDSEPVLEPYFSHGIPVLCEDVQRCCSEDSFFRRVLPLSRFAFLPTGRGTSASFALLMGWARGSLTVGTKALPLLRIIANLFGAVLANARLLAEVRQEKEILRRHANLTAGREIRMAELKRENAQLRALIIRLSRKVEGQNRE
jgi:hypothetical protein